MLVFHNNNTYKRDKSFIETKYQKYLRNRFSLLNLNRKINTKISIKSKF